MYLKSLEIQGFKSFAKKTILEFDRGITAVVGPNGSGKSNIADCLRWALGEQSPKLLRGKKSEDVIFAGSDKKIKQSFAEVFAIFDNRDHKIPLDVAEVSIGRRVNRSGESEYLINGNKVRLLDIVDLVMKSSIGTARYTVIGQGTIDQMILAGPPEVKNLIDEASGVKTYYIKRDKTLRRLEQTAQNLMRAEDLMAEIEPRLKSLRRQAKRMEARAEVERELKVYQREWYGNQYWDMHAAISKLQRQLEDLTAKRQEIDVRIQTHRQNIAYQESSNQLEMEKYKNMQMQLQQLQNQKNKILERASFIQGKMQSQKTGVAGDPKSLRVESHAITQKLSDAGMELVAVDRDIIAYEQEVLGLRASLNAFDSQLQKLYIMLSEPAQVDLSAFSHELQEFEREIENICGRLLSVADTTELPGLAQGLRGKYAKFKEHTKSLLSGHPQSVAKKIQEDLQTLAQAKDEAQTQLANAQLKVSENKLKQEFLRNQISNLEHQKLNVTLELKKAEDPQGSVFLDSLLAEEAQAKADLVELGKQIAQIELSIKQFYDSESAWKKLVLGEEKLLRENQDALDSLRDQETATAVEKTKFDTQMESLLNEAVGALGEDTIANIKMQLVKTETEDLEGKIGKLKHHLDMIGGVDQLTLQEYQETNTRYANLSAQVEDLKKGMQDLRSVIEELDGHIKSRFSEAFHRVNEKFEQYFRMLFNGGRAYLSVIKADELEESLDNEELNDGELTAHLRPEEKIIEKYEKGSTKIIGIDIKATPPNKKLSSIQALSGGERALTSIALLCSLLTCFPSPFVVLDEVDAALDEANTIRFGQILGTLAHQTQFITITHNRETMAQSNAIYGVTMGDDGISKLLSIKFDQAMAYAK